MITVGGLAGYNYYGTIENAYSAGEVKGNAEVGGLVGQNDRGTIRKSASSAKTRGNAFHIGGLVGYNNRGTIENAYSTGEVAGSYVGGLVGYNGGTITNTYTISKVNGIVNYIGGLVGCNGSGTTITNSYWTPEKAGIESSTGGIKIELTTDMQKQSTYEGFDFTQEEKIWVMKEYPELEWMQ